MTDSDLPGLAAEAELQAMVERAAQRGLGPLLGQEVTVVGRGESPWASPPPVLAMVSLASADNRGLRGVTWLGGHLEALLSVAELLVGERPNPDDEMFQDCVREMCNILGGQVQGQLRGVGISTGLGLPVYVSGARQLNLGDAVLEGVAVQVRVDHLGGAELQVGFAVEKDTWQQQFPTHSPHRRLSSAE